MYDMTFDIWTWLGGSNAIINENGIYGNIGEASLTNVPGARWSATMAFDVPSRSIFLFGGEGPDSDGQPGILDVKTEVAILIII